MKYLLFVLLLLIISYQLLASENSEAVINNPTQTIKYSTPFSLSIDFNSNKYKGNKIDITGINARFSFIGIGFHFKQGQEVLDHNKDYDIIYNYPRNNLQGWFVDLQGYYDLKLINTSIYGIIGYGTIKGQQYVYLSQVWKSGEPPFSYVASPTEPTFNYGIVYGIGAQFHPYSCIVVGAKWDSINYFSLQIGIGFCLPGPAVISNYFK